MRIETCKHSNTAGTCYICWHELIEDRDRLAAELAGLRAQVPVAWMHETRVDVIHESVRTLLKTLSGGAGPESLHRPIDKSERYTIPLYAAPVPAQVPDVICVGRARFPKAGGNAGISWYAEDTLGDTAGHRTGQPNDGELLFVLAAAQKGE